MLTAGDALGKTLAKSMFLGVHEKVKYWNLRENFPFQEKGHFHVIIVYSQMMVPKKLGVAPNP